MDEATNVRRSTDLISGRVGTGHIWQEGGTYLYFGVLKRVVIFGVEDENPRYPGRGSVPTTILINPVITPLDNEMEDGWEGCLSVPGMRGLVPRYQRVHYRGFDENGKLIERDADGFHARVVQHECDHLDGILYPQRIQDMTQFGFREELLDKMGC